MKRYHVSCKMYFDQHFHLPKKTTKD